MTGFLKLAWHCYLALCYFVVNSMCVFLFYLVVNAFMAGALYPFTKVIAYKGYRAININVIHILILYDRGVHRRIG